MNVVSIRSNILPIVFTLAVFSLIWRQGNVVVSGIPKLFEVLIGLALLVSIAEIIYSSASRSVFLELKSVWLSYGMLFGFLSLFILIGHSFSNASFPGWISYESEVYFEYARILFVFILFFLSIYVVVRYKKSIKWILGAVAFSPLVLFLAFAPRWQEFFVDNARLIGARNDPNYLATFLALGLIFAAVYFLYSRPHSRWFGILYIVLFFPLFLWAHSRAAFLSIAATLIVLAIIYVVKKRSFRSLGFVGILGSVFVFAIVASFFVLPSDSQLLIYRRSIVLVSPSESLNKTVADFILDGDTKLRTVALTNISTNTFDVSRGALWRDALWKSTKSPLGFGPAYHNWNPVFGPGRPHNLWLEVALTAGWGGLVIWVVLMITIFRDLIAISRRNDFVDMALAGGFVYLLINGTFADMLTLRWMWLVMGMIVGYAFLKRNEKSERLISGS